VRGPTWRRRLPAILTVAGLSVLVLSIARPQAVIGVPRYEGTVVLAFDVSGSMAATDIAPSRMEAAKAAAIALVDQQPPSIRIGVVVFSDSGFSTLVPTYDRLEVIAAIGRLEPERGTSLGRGILASLDLIAAADAGEETDFYSNASPPPEPTPAPTPVPDGHHEPAVVVLLTDGENTVQPGPLDGAVVARDRGIRVDTVGVGTTEGATLEVEGFRVHTTLDEATLQAVADNTDGTYYPAADPSVLAGIYDDVGGRFVVREEPFELTPIFAAAGFALLLIGGLASLRWFGRMP
jgi:Ca-activated chloride channel homolog